MFDAPEGRANLRYIAVSLLAFGLQGAVLAYVLERPDDTAAWLTWGGTLVFAGSVITVAMRRAVVNSRRYRAREWGEQHENNRERDR